MSKLMPGEPWPTAKAEPRPLMYEATRDIIPGERGYYGERLIVTGERVYCFSRLATDMPDSTMVSEYGPTDYPCFEVPKDAIRVVHDK